MQNAILATHSEMTVAQLLNLQQTALGNPDNPGWAFFHFDSFRIFDVDTCETCGSVTMAANAARLRINGNPSAEQLCALTGMAEWTGNLPPEQYVIDDDGTCGCERCSA